MARYIDADLLMQKLSRMIDYCKKANISNGLTVLFQVGDAIMDCPTADVVEVKHGKWVFDNKIKRYRCSICENISYSGNAIYHNENLFCGHCGARMDLKEGAQE